MPKYQAEVKARPYGAIGTFYLLYVGDVEAETEAEARGLHIDRAHAEKLETLPPVVLKIVE